MKVKSSLRLLCKCCKFVRRRKRNFVVCASNPKHKQRSGFHTFAAGEEVQQAWQTSRPTLHHNTCSCHGCGGSRFVTPSLDTLYQTCIPCCCMVPRRGCNQIGAGIAGCVKALKMELNVGDFYEREVFSYAAPLGGMSVGNHIFRLR